MKEKRIISPCQAICQMDNENHYCMGCYRTLQEISQWKQYSSLEKNAVMEQLPLRRQDEN